ncbi:hypothetical protein GXW78_06735 [Roseomonas terrae]|uniref:Uncharacterized protein n=1 Tax=Neoroseomonas terrae TaxID=424799 RepID=A0ABS5EEA5_9PROT|nr:hypothetical protein [Neoroseomonas terrae]MBR0649351.1 hypothetical protein [Neoroseomonas terrae]
MSSILVSMLHQEERTIVAELRASRPFQRLEAIRRLLALYDEQPSVATGLDAPVGAEPDRGGGEVISFAAPPQPAAVAPSPAAASPVTVASAIPLPGPGTAAAAAPAARVEAMAEAAVADVAMRSPAPVAAAEPEASSVVSSVRAALLGIGKN